MSVYRQGLAAEIPVDLEARLAPRRLGRLLAALAAMAAATWMVASGAARAAPALALIPLAWALGAALGRRLRVGRVLAGYSVRVPLLAWTIVPLVLGIALFGRCM